MNHLDFLINIKKTSDFELNKINGYICNKLACFLMVNSKNLRFFTDKELYLKQQISYNFLPIGSNKLECDIIYIEFESYLRIELKKAFENPEKSYKSMMIESHKKYKEYRQMIDFNKYFFD